MRRFSWLLVTAVLTLLMASAAGAITYTVEVRNDIAGGMETGQPFSAPLVIVHDGGYDAVQLGALASLGLIQLAEEGDASVLVAEAAASPSVRETLSGTGPFITSQIVTFDADPGDLVTVLFMLGRTNDLFSGIDGVVLQPSGDQVFATDVYDAGSEANSGLIADIPFYGFSGTGTDESVAVQIVSGYQIYDDPTYGMLSWVFPPAAQVTIRVAGSVATEPTRWGAIKALYR